MKLYTDEALKKVEANAMELYAKLARVKPSDEFTLSDIENTMYYLKCFADEVRHEGCQRKNQAMNREQEKNLVFEAGKSYAPTTTASGKRAVVYKNDRNLHRQLYQLTVEGKTVFARGTIEKVFETLKAM